MIQVLTKFHIAVPSRRNVKISLHLIALQTPINPTRLSRIPPLQSRRLLEFSLRAPDLPEDVSYVRILLLLPDHLPTLQPVHLVDVDPVPPIGCVFAEHITRQYTIAAGILHVDVQIWALHRHHDVEVDLQVVGDALLHAKEVGFVAGVPASQLGEGEDRGNYDEGEGSVAAGGAATGIGGFGFGWKGEESESVLGNDQKTGLQRLGGI